MQSQFFHQAVIWFQVTISNFLIIIIVVAVVVVDNDDFAVLADHRVKLKESEKKDK